MNKLFENWREYLKEEDLDDEETESEEEDLDDEEAESEEEDLETLKKLLRNFFLSGRQTIELANLVGFPKQAPKKKWWQRSSGPKFDVTLFNYMKRILDLVQEIVCLGSPEPGRRAEWWPGEDLDKFKTLYEKTNSELDTMWKFIFCGSLANTAHHVGSTADEVDREHEYCKKWRKDNNLPPIDLIFSGDEEVINIIQSSARGPGSSANSLAQLRHKIHTLHTPPAGPSHYLAAVKESGLASTRFEAWDQLREWAGISETLEGCTGKENKGTDYCKEVDNMLKENKKRLKEGPEDPPVPSTDVSRPRPPAPRPRPQAPSDPDYPPRPPAGGYKASEKEMNRLANNAAIMTNLACEKKNLTKSDFINKSYTYLVRLERKLSMLILRKYRLKQSQLKSWLEKRGVVFRGRVDSTLKRVIKEILPGGQLTGAFQLLDNEEWRDRASEVIYNLLKENEELLKEVGLRVLNGDVEGAKILIMEELVKGVGGWLKEKFEQYQNGQLQFPSLEPLIEPTSAEDTTRAEEEARRLARERENLQENKKSINRILISIKK